MKTNSTVKKTHATKRKVQAGIANNLLSTGGKKMPTTGGYAGRAKIFSPSSRGI